MNYPAIPREFFNGDCFDAYRILGAHPCTAPDGAEGWRFAVWAPGATAVEVCGGFDGWEAGVPMERAETGVWSAFIPGLAEGDLYKYRVHGADGSVVMRSDPYAFSTELRPGTASRLAKLDFAFDDHAWMERRDKCRNRPLNIYELHAGSWKHKPGSTQPDGSDGWYNYEELAKELIPWLLDHHFTHVELLPLAEHPFDCNFNYYRREVCSFLSSAAGLWMDVYHCDGIRMDAISRALYWQGDPNRGVNQGAVNFLRSLNHGLNKRWPTGIYMAEDSTNFLKVTAPTRYDGVGFDYKWDMGWMHDTLDYFATPFGERPNAYGKLLFSMHYFYNELYLLALSHDEVVHGKKTIIDKLWGTYAEKCAQLRTLYFYMYMHPGKKLNFMGNELGHFREWDEKRELDWDLLKYPFHDAFQKYFARLSLVYATEPALFDGEYNPDCFEWVASESCTEGVYAWLRKGRGQNLLCIMNTQDHAHKKFPLYLKFPCSAELVLDTEAAEWGGAHKGRRKLHFHTTDGGVYGRDYTLTVDLPAMGSFLLRLTPEAPNPDAARISANKAMAQKRRTARAKNSSK